MNIHVHHNKHYTTRATTETKLTKNKMEKHNQVGFAEYGTCVTEGSVKSCQHTTMASACGTMHPPVCQMNESQGIESVGYVTKRASGLYKSRFSNPQRLAVFFAARVRHPA